MTSSVRRSVGLKQKSEKKRGKNRRQEEDALSSLYFSLPSQIFLLPLSPSKPQFAVAVRPYHLPKKPTPLASSVWLTKQGSQQQLFLNTQQARLYRILTLFSSFLPSFSPKGTNSPLIPPINHSTYVLTVHTTMHLSGLWHCTLYTTHSTVLYR